MRRELVVGVMAAAFLAPLTATAADDGPADMARLLGSEAVQRVDFRAESWEAARGLIKTVVAAYLEKAVPLFGSEETAQERGVDVIQGMDDHTIRYSVTTFFAPSIPISTEDDARLLGEALAATASVIAKASDGMEVKPDWRGSAKRVFESVRVVSGEAGSGESVLQQYHDQLVTLSTRPQAALSRYLVVKE